MASSPPHVRIPVNNSNEVDSRRQSSVDIEDISDREASEEQERPVIDIAEEGGERAGLLSGVLTDEEKRGTANEVKYI